MLRKITVFMMFLGGGVLLSSGEPERPDVKKIVEALGGGVQDNSWVPADANLFHFKSDFLKAYEAEMHKKELAKKIAKRTKSK